MAANILCTIPAVDFYQHEASTFIQVRFHLLLHLSKSSKTDHGAETAPSLQAKLDNILRSTTSFQDSTAAQATPPAGALAAGPQVPSQTSQQVAQHMVKAGQVIAAGLVVAAQMTARGIEKGTAMAMSKTPAATEPMKPEVKTKFARAASASGAAVSATKTAAAGLASIAGVAAQMISKHVENTDTAKKLAANKNVQVLRGAAGQAAADVGSAWQQAAKMVSERSGVAGRSFIQHKFGADNGAASTSQPQPPPAYEPPAYQPPQFQQPGSAPAYPPAGAPPAYADNGPVQGVPAAAAPAAQQASTNFYPYIPGAPAVGTPVVPQAPGTTSHPAP